MQKYSSLIFGGLITLAAIVLIVWIMRDSSNAIQSAVAASPGSDNEGVDTLDGLAPNNAVVEVAGPHLTYNVPEPGTVPPIDPNSDFITGGQLADVGVNTADWSLSNLMEVGLPPNDFVN